MTFTVLVTVEVEAETQQDAYNYIAHALDHARLAEIKFQEFKVTAEREDEP